MGEQRELLTTGQVAEMIGKSIRTVQRLAESGALPAIRLEDPTRYIFDLDDVERYLDQDRTARKRAADPVGRGMDGAFNDSFV